MRRGRRNRNGDFVTVWLIVCKWKIAYLEAWAQHYIQLVDSYEKALWRVSAMKLQSKNWIIHCCHQVDRAMRTSRQLIARRHLRVNSTDFFLFLSYSFSSSWLQGSGPPWICGCTSMLQSMQFSTFSQWRTPPLFRKAANLRTPNLFNRWTR